MVNREARVDRNRTFGAIDNSKLVQNINNKKLDTKQMAVDANVKRLIKNKKEKNLLFSGVSSPKLSTKPKK